MTYHLPSRFGLKDTDLIAKQSMPFQTKIPAMAVTFFSSAIFLHLMSTRCGSIKLKAVSTLGPAGALILNGGKTLCFGIT